MSFGCQLHTAWLFDRGGRRMLGQLTPLSLVRWDRVRDGISTATIIVPTRAPDCDPTVGIVATGRHELVIMRGEERVWEGPVTHVTFTGDQVEIQARDVMHYVYRTAMKGEYDNRYPNVVTVLQRVQGILQAELARKEAMDPPINVLPYVQYHHRPGDARTSTHTLPFISSVFDHVDTIAARAGLDYTVVGRSIHFFDVDTVLGTTAPVGASDFLGDVVITEYGMELATYVAINDGEGNAGEAGGADPYYGLVEVVHAAYDESEGADEEGPSVAEMRSQAQRVLAGANPVPVVVRVPDGSTLNPEGVLGIRDLFPGVRIPLIADLPGKTMQQMQRLDSVRVEESGGSGIGQGVGESVMVTLSPAPYVEE